MSYRDESDALRARIVALEARLRDKKGVGEVLFAAELGSPWLFGKRVFRHSLTLDGQLSKDGMDAIQQMLWARVGTPSEPANLGDGTLLDVSRGASTFRITETSGRTHLSVDHRRLGFTQLLGAFSALGVVMVLSMLAAGVHDDWNQMVAVGYAIFVLFVGPLIFFRGRNQHVKSVALLKSVVALAKEHVAFGPRVRIERDRAAKEELEAEARDVRAEQTP